MITLFSSVTASKKLHSAYLSFQCLNAKHLHPPSFMSNREHKGHLRKHMLDFFLQVVNFMSLELNQANVFNLRENIWCWAAAPIQLLSDHILRNVY